jgi:arylsulfatase A-like enzyme
MQPNVVLVTVECFRADHLGTLTPRIFQFAQEATSFLDAHTSGGWTRISLTALMSSAYASMYGGPRVALAAPSRRTLAECLLEKGYWTAGFTANPACGTAAGVQRGFGHFDETRREPNLPPGTPRGRDERWRYMEGKGAAPCDAETFINAGELTNLGVKWLAERAPGDPFFLWLHYQDPHWPCQMQHRPSTIEDLHEAWQDLHTFREHVMPSQGRFDPGLEARARWTRRYGEALTSADAQIGRLLNHLQSRPDWNRTIVALTGDHGEELYEHGTWHHSWNQLHREGTHVPLIIRAPGCAPSTRNEPVSLLDLTPTLLDFAGIDQPRVMIGKSLRPVVEGRQAATRPVFSEMMGHNNSTMYRLAIRDGDWKYIYDLDQPRHSKLFRVSDDPDEHDNLREARGAVFLRFERMRLAHVASTLTNLADFSEKSTTTPIETGILPADGVGANYGDPVLREQMEALGYL